MSEEIKIIVGSINSLTQTVTDLNKNVGELNGKVKENIKNTSIRDENFRKDIKEIYNKLGNNSEAILKVKAPCQNEGPKCPPMEKLEELTISSFKTKTLWTFSTAGLMSFIAHIAAFTSKFAYMLFK